MIFRSGLFGISLIFGRGGAASDSGAADGTSEEGFQKMVLKMVKSLEDVIPELEFDRTEK